MAEFFLAVKINQLSNKRLTEILNKQAIAFLRYLELRVSNWVTVLKSMKLMQKL